jgi:hypothetical protein
VKEVLSSLFTRQIASVLGMTADLGKYTDLHIFGKKFPGRYMVGAAVIVVHAACFVAIIYFKDDAFTQPQRIDLGLLLLPITAAYVVAIVRSAIVEQSNPAVGRPVSLNYCIIISLFTAITLVGLFITVVQLRGDPDIARRQILLFEIAFGTAFGLIATDLFGKIEQIPVEQMPVRHTGNN